MRMNAIYNCKNPFQGEAKRILCVCSAGLLRSPTLAGELYKRGYNTRAAGVHDYALVEVDEVLLMWADTIIFVNKDLKYAIEDRLLNKHVIEMNIPDSFEFRHPKLVEIINQEIDKLEANGDLANK